MDLQGNTSGMVITARARMAGKNKRVKTHYLVGDRWFDLVELAALIPLNDEGKSLSHQALSGRMHSAEDILNNPAILKPRLTTADRVAFAAIARKNSPGGTAAADNGTGTGPDTVGAVQRAKLAAIPLGIYDNL